jgi:hypothetical protein
MGWTPPPSKRHRCAKVEVSDDPPNENGSVRDEYYRRTNTNGWLTNLLNRRDPNIAAVALANKNVRTVWALLAHGRDFRADYVPTRMAA